MKILILGGGIKGLSTAWSCLQQNPKAEITLLEKEARLGGWIQTSREEGFFFERGPRTFSLGRSPKLLHLIRELNLEMVKAKPQTRYILHRGKLRSLASLLPRFIPTLIRECFTPPAHHPQESIYDFAARRFSPEMAETLFDPLTLGIYAGNCRHLSLRACFPSLYEWEQKHGSVVRGLLASPKQEKGLFTLLHGMDTLIETLQKRLPIDIVLNCEVTQIRDHEVIAGGKIWRADQIISALPSSLPAESLWVVHLAYAGDVLPKKGFGYLVPTREQELLLGVVFDSSIFPQQSRSHETRLTAMLRASTSHPLEATLDALDRHLSLKQKPLYSAVSFAKNAIPQLSPGTPGSSGVSVESSIAPSVKH